MAIIGILAVLLAFMVGASRVFFAISIDGRSRTTYRRTVIPMGSTHVDTFTGTTSWFFRAAFRETTVVVTDHH